MRVLRGLSACCTLVLAGCVHAGAPWVELGGKIIGNSKDPNGISNSDGIGVCASQDITVAPKGVVDGTGQVQEVRRSIFGTALNHAVFGRTFQS